MPTFLIIETKEGIFILLPVVARRKVDMLEDRERKKKITFGKDNFHLSNICEVPGIFFSARHLSQLI